MSKLSEVLEHQIDFYCESGAATEEVEEAENRLGIKFAIDYKEYLQLYGSVSCAGHELTGISADRNLDVVSVTMRNYKKNPNIEDGFYVIEETHVDGIVIWQTCSGEIFQSEYKDKPVKIYDSLLEYIHTFSKFSK